MRHVLPSTVAVMSAPACSKRAASSSCPHLHLSSRGVIFSSSGAQRFCSLITHSLSLENSANVSSMSHRKHFVASASFSASSCVMFMMVE
eukprot:CAMPEP_0173422022 /NCGR_PEP_ID=MMETSP1357-20121228/2891_1 /TAXON_ID=77926 /ORGANISM="Hemiselmis rufescens, Strain PCC563" /LENGTH=89 /DNA_ID=CAMNT_0014384995 /DNA_START=156 /DNA_END=425 /DNA_ORIENTATION=+